MPEGTLLPFGEGARIIVVVRGSAIKVRVFVTKSEQAEESHFGEVLLRSALRHLMRRIGAAKGHFPLSKLDHRFDVLLVWSCGRLT